MVIPAIILGVLCGIYSAYYIGTGSVTRRKIGQIKSPVMKNIISGLTLGILLAAFPALYGEGYGVLADLAAGKLAAVSENSVFWWMHSPTNFTNLFFRADVCRSGGHPAGFGH